MKVLMSIIFSIIIFGSVGYSVYRIFVYKPNEMAVDKKYSSAQITFYALIFRLLVYAVSILFVANIDGAVDIDVFLDRWTRWDANNYVRITEGWYTGYTENSDFLTLVFFPLYPILAKMLTFIIPNVHISLLLTSSIAYAVGCGYLYELVCLDYEEKTAINSVIWISVFPFAFFFGAIMTESVFFMTTAMSLYYIRCHKWGMVGICGALSAFSRMIGVLSIVPAMVEWFDFYKPFTAGRHKLKRIIIKVLPVFIAFLGIGAYLFINYQVTGNPFMFMQYQDKYWNHTNCYFGSTIADIFEYALSPETDSVTRLSIWIPEAVIFTLVAMILIYSSYYTRNMYSIYLAGYVVINCSVTWLISGARYMTAAIPMFVVLACVTGKNKILSAILQSLSLALMLFYLFRYLANMQIM